MRKGLFLATAIPLISSSIINAQTPDHYKNNAVQPHQTTSRDMQRLQTMFDAKVNGQRQMYIDGVVRSVNCAANTIVVHDTGLRRNYSVHAAGFNGIVVQNAARRQNMCQDLELRPYDVVNAIGVQQRLDGRYILQHGMLRLKRRG